MISSPKPSLIKTVESLMAAHNNVLRAAIDKPASDFPVAPGEVEDFKRHKRRFGLDFYFLGVMAFGPRALLQDPAGSIDQEYVQHRKKNAEICKLVAQSAALAGELTMLLYTPEVRDDKIHYALKPEAKIEATEEEKELVLRGVKRYVDELRPQINTVGNVVAKIISSRTSTILLAAMMSDFPILDEMPLPHHADISVLEKFRGLEGHLMKNEDFELSLPRNDPPPQRFGRAKT